MGLLSSFSSRGLDINPVSTRIDGISGDFYKTLFLCGEHTTFDYAGTLHGAYITGIWAAEAIAEEETE